MSDILSCTEQRMFWLKWDDGQISVSKHTPGGSGLQPFINYEDDAPQTVSYLSFITGFSVQGEWDFFNITGKLKSGNSIMLGL